MKITEGKHNAIIKYFPDYNRCKSSVICEAGNDNGIEFKGSFLFKIPYKGIYRIDNNILTKKVK